MDKSRITTIKDRLEKIGEHLKSQKDSGSGLSAKFDEVRQSLDEAVELYDQGQNDALEEDLRIFEGSIEVYLEENPDAGIKKLPNKNFLKLSKKSWSEKYGWLQRFLEHGSEKGNPEE